MSKKRIIITGGAGLASFLLMFILAWLTTASPEEKAVEASQPAAAGEGTKVSAPQQPTAAAENIDRNSGETGKSIADKQLKSLVQEVREKIQEYNNKLEGLEAEEQRVHIAQETLKKDINKLLELQVELATTVSKLKSERETFLKERVKIAQAEKSNLISIAATYDKMDAGSASKILSSMSQIQNAAARSASVDDAVKILHYMTERTKAKVLAELSTSEPKLAAALCQKLKQIMEE